MLHRSFLASHNNNPASTTYLTSWAPSLGTIPGHPHILEVRRTLTNSQLCLHLRASPKILDREHRDGCELPRLTGHQGVMDRLAMLGIMSLWRVKEFLLARTMAVLVEGPEGGARQGCRMMSGRDSEKIIM